MTNGNKSVFLLWIGYACLDLFVLMTKKRFSINIYNRNISEFWWLRFLHRFHNRPTNRKITYWLESHFSLFCCTLFSFHKTGRWLMTSGLWKLLRHQLGLKSLVIHKSNLRIGTKPELSTKASSLIIAVQITLTHPLNLQTDFKTRDTWSGCC